MRLLKTPRLELSTFAVEDSHLVLIVAGSSDRRCWNRAFDASALVVAGGFRQDPVCARGEQDVSKRGVPAASHKHDGHAAWTPKQVLLQLRTAPAGHLHVEHQATAPSSWWKPGFEFVSDALGFRARMLFSLHVERSLISECDRWIQAYRAPNRYSARGERDGHADDGPGGEAPGICGINPV